jgi:hypothetical protein
MTIEDLYLKISKNPELKKTSPLFETYMDLYNAWSMMPNASSPLLTGLSQLLQDIQTQFPEVVGELLQGERVEDLRLPERVSIPAFRELDQKILPPSREGATLATAAPPKPASVEEEVEEPGLLKKAGSFVAAMTDFAGSGFKRVTSEQLAERKAICAGCKFFDPTGYAGAGKCKKCGCSSYKLDIAASRCPVGYWESIQ